MNFPSKWKISSTCIEKLVLNTGKLTGNPSGRSYSVHGTPIAKEGIVHLFALCSSTAIMTQALQTSEISIDPPALQSVHFAWGTVLISTLLVATYYRVLAGLAGIWWQDPNYSHGLLVPIFAVYLVWKKRETILNKRVDPTWSGVSVVGLGLVVLLLGVYGATIFLARASLVVVLAGLGLGFGGWQLLKELRFALLVLFLAIPIPTIIFNQIALPLQLLASKLATALLLLSGVPVLREGNVIQLPAIKLEVADACSGIRSLVSLLTLAIFYGYFLEKTFLRRAVLALACIPIAIAANAIRIFGTGLCVQYWDPEKAMGFFHEFSGWVMFLVSIGCLFIVHRAMRLLLARRRRT